MTAYTIDHKAKSCLRCSKFISCRDPKKSSAYTCIDFKRLREVSSFDGLDALFDMVPRGTKDPDIELLNTGPSTSELVKATPGISKLTKTLDSVMDKRLEEELTTDLLDKIEDTDFIWVAMQEAYDPLTNSVRDVKIDDRDLKLGFNYYDFCTRIAGKAIKMPFARQLFVAYNLLGEYCPRCTDPKWLDIDNIPVDMDTRDLARKVVLLKHGTCPSCGITKAKLVIQKELKDYNELALLLGQRAGKSSFASTLSADISHRFLKAPRLSTICNGIQEFTPLTATFVALTASRAIKLLWNPFIAIIDSSAWFQDYFSLLRTYGRKYDRELYKKTGLYVHFHHKNLAFYPSPPMKKTLRGDTRFLAATDELSFFAFNPNRNPNDIDEAEDDRERADGPEVQASLANSLATVRTEVYNLYKKNVSVIPQGLNINMSSPASRNDTLTVIERDSHHPDSLTYGLKLPTWEMSPMFSRDHPIIVEAYRKNHVKAERDFGANPPEMASALYTPEAVKGLFKEGVLNTHKVLYLESPKLTQARIVNLAPVTVCPPAVMTIDAGLVNNSFAFCVGYRQDTKFTFYTVGEVIPTSNKPIDYPGMYTNVLLPLAKELNAVIVGADRWNSISTLQQFEKDLPQTKSIQNMLRYIDFVQFTTAAQNGDLVFPSIELAMDRILLVQDYKVELRNTPMSHLALQFCTVRDTGTAVIKGDGYTDDMYRTAVLAYKLAFSAKTKNHLARAKTIKLNDTTSKSKGRIIVGGRSLINFRR